MRTTLVLLGSSLKRRKSQNRSLKTQIIEQINNKENSAAIFENLSTLADTDLLKKDYLEIFAYYCLSAGHELVLVDQAAKHIIENYNTFVCFGLPKIVESIEKKQIHTLASVIVAHAYYKYISDNKDYVLHETLEDFLSLQGIEKPSDLFSRFDQSNLSAIWIQFFLNKFAFQK